MSNWQNSSRMFLFIASTILLVTLTVGRTSSTAHAQTIQVVNMVPPGLSSETNQDSEPDITVNPNNPLEIIGTAFTPNPSGSMTSAPIYISQDGGATWVLNNIVPSGNGMTGDITVTLSRNNVLYAGILRGGGGLDMRILRSASYTGAALMDQLLGRTNEDQPYARSHSPLGGGQRNKDHLYVGHNDLSNNPRSASFEQSLDAQTAAAPAGLTTIRLERRTPFNQDGPPIRPAIHPDGTIYAVYTQRTASSGSDRTGNIVVVRDDDWGQGVNPYSDVTDPSDAIAGRFVVSGVTWVFNGNSVFGQERLGDRATIAVDPRDSQTVYVGWVDRPAPATGNNATVHIRRSTDGGSAWSADLLTVGGAISPQLAVTIQGRVGVVYQQLTGTAPNQRWQTHFRQSSDGGTIWNDITLADTPANNPAVSFLPYLGDYIGLVADGKDFLGIFSASNIPNNANFPNGVTYQRAADFMTNLLNDGAGNPVAVSIDPFFFRARNLAYDRDFYVRDWTDSSTINDIGLEPSTDPVFYNTSDVWNRRTDAGGGFDANDRPISEDPQVSTLGNNFAFTRVHRKATGTAATVNLHFLKSEFGTGSNYQDANTTADPTLSFGAADQVLTLSSGYEWTLTATSSTHVCLAVEISTTEDPVVAPSLLGRAPGWPDTDLSVIYDNNKGQRNLGVFTGAGEGGSITYWALVHNAANIRRDLILRMEGDERFTELFKLPRLVSVGGKARLERDRIVFPAMTPCEHRWVGLTIPVTRQQGEGERVAVNFAELVGNVEVNGFTIAVDRVPIEIGGVENLRSLASNLHRMGHMFKIEDAIELSKKLAKPVAAGKIPPDEYVEHVKSLQETYGKLLGTVIDQTKEDPFSIASKLAALGDVLNSGDANRICPQHADLEHAVDAFLTFMEKKKGDTADVAQNMRWQLSLMENIPNLSRMVEAAQLAKLSGEFDRGFSARTLSLKDYSTYMEKSIPALNRINEALVLGQRETLLQIEKSLRDLPMLQMLHCTFLQQLEEVRSKDPAAAAPFVVIGTVVAARETTVPQLRPSDQTFVVDVEKVLVQNKTFGDQSGKKISVVDPQQSLQVGKQYTIYAEPFLFGKGLAVRLIKAEEDPRVDENKPEIVRQSQQSQIMKERLRQAELVVVGTVTAVRPFEQRDLRESEHLPDLKRAIVKVERVLKGTLRGQQVEFLFAGSIDVHWFRAPKFKGGETGVFLLNSGTSQAETLKLDAREYTLFDPLDFQPRDRADAIEALLR